VLSAETKSTEPSKHFPKLLLAIRDEASEISVIFILLAVFSPPTEILHPYNILCKKKSFFADLPAVCVAGLSANRLAVAGTATPTVIPAQLVLPAPSAS